MEIQVGRYRYCVHAAKPLIHGQLAKLSMAERNPVFVDKPLAGFLEEVGHVVVLAKANGHP